ncbi:TonB-dependent receptor [uncultured Cetobacterium sp.]|uniref:TonB-dependent receptor n=1 Tax=uncultured Cetobacterium sp. TaxID=527638 RepID=UPI002631FDC7|nr:TonB-dependent receptor [uncultured Cetobacterium sp.]
MKSKLFLLAFICASAQGADLYTEGVILNESVISTSGYEESLKNTPKNIQIITKEDIEENNYKDVSEILESSSLISISKNSIGESIQMRGSGLNSKGTVQILVDGTSINPVDINHGIIPLNSIEVANIEKIEILPGGNGVLYGDGFTGGMVNIITKSTVEKTKSYVGARYGENNQKKFETGSSIKVNDNIGLIINYSNENNKTDRDFENNKSQHFDITSLLKISEKDKLSLKYSYYNKKSETAELLNKEEFESNKSQSGVDFNGAEFGKKYKGLKGSGDILDKSKLRRDEFSFNYNRSISSDLELNIKGSYQKNKNDIKSKEETYANFPTLTNPFNYLEYYADNIGTFTDEKLKVNPSLKYKYGENSYLILGYDYKLQKSKRNFENFMDMYKVYNLNSEKESHGAYVFNKTKIDKLELLQGFRREWTDYDTTKESHYYHRVKPGFLNNGYIDGGFKRDHIRKKMRNDSYEFAINYLYSNSGNIYTRFEQSFRTPAPTEFQDKVNNSYKINNLDSEINQTLEAGLKDYLLGSTVAINTFIGRTKGEIYYNEVTHGKEWTYSNLDETQRKGIESSFSQEFGKIKFIESLSYVDAKIKKDNINSNYEGNQVPYTSKLKGNISAKIDWSKKLNSILSFNYKDGYYLDKANKYKANSNITLDLTVNYIMDNGLKLYGGINNILDRKNFDQEAISNGEKVFDPSEGRHFYSGFKYTF